MTSICIQVVVSRTWATCGQHSQRYMVTCKMVFLPWSNLECYYNTSSTLGGTLIHCRFRDALPWLWFMTALDNHLLSYSFPQMTKLSYSSAFFFPFHLFHPSSFHFHLHLLQETCEWRIMCENNNQTSNINTLDSLVWMCSVLLFLDTVKTLSSVITNSPLGTKDTKSTQTLPWFRCFQNMDN